MRHTANWRLRTRTIELGRRTLVMGVVNVTPDSFSDGGRFLDRDAAVAHALKLMEEGPRIERIDVARAQVGQAAAELAKAEWRLSNCIIRAPVSGTILKKNAEEGNIVNPVAMPSARSRSDRGCCLVAW